MCMKLVFNKKQTKMIFLVIILLMITFLSMKSPSFLVGALKFVHNQISVLSFSNLNLFCCCLPSKSYFAFQFPFLNSNKIN